MLNMLLSYFSMIIAVYINTCCTFIFDTSDYIDNIHNFIFLYSELIRE